MVPRHSLQCTHSFVYSSRMFPARNDRVTTWLRLYGLDPRQHDRGDPPSAFCACIGTMNRGGPNVGQASRLPRRARQRERGHRRGVGLAGGAGETPALLSGSWRAPFRFRECIGTMNLNCVLLLLVILLSLFTLHSSIKSKSKSKKSSGESAGGIILTSRFMEREGEIFCRLCQDVPIQYAGAIPRLQIVATCLTTAAPHENHKTVRTKP